jgi:deoxyribonuclease-4
MSSSERRLGVHTSIAGGVQLSLERARALGCNTLQIFSHNPRQWRAKEIPEDSLVSFGQRRKAYDMDPVFIHSSYLINLASSDQTIFEKSVRLVIQEMDIADRLDADYVILHTGSASREPEGVGRKRAIKALKVISTEGEWKAKLLLENTAGERGDITSRIGDLAEIISETDSPFLGGVCLDTCHAFSAGYNIAHAEGLSELAREIRAQLGFERVKLIHLNDSKKGHNARVDRHEHLGAGGIGREGLKRFVNHPPFANIPLILETPKKTDGDDPRNLAVVRSLLG